VKAVSPIWQPRADQLAGVEFALAREAAGLFAKPGVGKTAMFLSVLDALRSQREAQSAIVVTPLRPLYSTWPAEIQKWQFPFSVGILHGPKKADVLSAKHDVYLINPEGVDWLTDEIAAGNLPPWVDTLCVDESTKFKNPSAKRFKYLREVLHRFRNRYILTGTPQTRSLEDLWSQVFLLDGGKRLGAYITHFRRRFMVDAAPPRANFSDWQPMPGAEDEVYRLISDLCITIPSPRTDKPLWNPISVVLPKPAMAIYKRMEQEFVLELQAGTVTAANAGAKTMKMRQITGGFVYGEEKAVHAVHDAKLDAMVDFIEELGDEPLLVAVNFDHEAQAVQARLRKDFGLVVPYFGGGGLKGREGQAAVDAWNQGKTRVLVANPQSAAHGLNLQHGGSNCLWFSLTYNWEDWEQFNNRLDRVGQKNTVVISALLADDTIDQDVLAVLNGRGDADKNLFNVMRGKHERSKKAA
jgi:hypothetical protein